MNENPIVIQIGDTTRCYCGCCQIEFEIVLEPKVAEDPRLGEGCPRHTAIIEHCPFCGCAELEEA